MEPIDILAGQWVAQDKVLERMPWLSSHQLAEFRRKGLRFQRARGGFVYRVADLAQALEDSLACEMNDCGSTPAAGSVESREAHTSTSSGTSQEDEEFVERAFAQLIVNRRAILTP